MSDPRANDRPTVQIEYCVPCGHLPRAMDVQRTILERFGQRVEGVKLKTGKDGVFVISVGDEVVYRKPDEFRLEAVLEEIERRAPAA
ncbi:MAG TPA: Rdx family protein [Trueperaceae bacterium]|mgnify:CR=1 FL=1|jgi:selenoprotein W-related protein|nr:Rdx family protein [Trueperaceae bacterium]